MLRSRQTLGVNPRPHADTHIHASRLCFRKSGNRLADRLPPFAASSCSLGNSAAGSCAGFLWGRRKRQWQRVRFAARADSYCACYTGRILPSFRTFHALIT